VSFVVTIDGPAAAGKSTTARAVAARLGFLYIDTGALYRALALKVLEEGVVADDLEAVETALHGTELDLSGSPDTPHVRMDGRDVTDAIRTPEVSEMASRLAAQRGVRARLVDIQRDLRARGPLVGEGRDLGTVVFPDADVKVYLEAEAGIRARRRYRELQERGIAMSLEDVLAEIDRRDRRDRERPDSPLAVAPGATVIDTSGMDVDGQVRAVLDVIQAHSSFPGVGRGPA